MSLLIHSLMGHEVTVQVLKHSLSVYSRKPARVKLRLLAELLASLNFEQV